MKEKIKDIIAAFEGMDIVRTNKVVSRADNTNIFEFHLTQHKDGWWKFYHRFCADQPWYDKYLYTAKEAHEYLKSKQPDCDERYVLCICKNRTGETVIFTVNKENYKFYSQGFRSTWIATTYHNVCGECYAAENEFV